MGQEHWQVAASRVLSAEITGLDLNEIASGDQAGIDARQFASSGTSGDLLSRSADGHRQPCGAR